MKIVSIVKDSFIEIARYNWGISLFSFGCNLQCSFCKGYNYETVTNKNNIIGEAIEIMEAEVKPCHDCVIFIGGEPTIWGDSLIEALKWCKERGKKTKIFSNGFNYAIIKKMKQGDWFMEKTYNVSEASKKIGGSVKTLQRWDREGILKANRTPTDRRYYTYGQYLQFKGIQTENDI